MLQKCTAYLFLHVDIYFHLCVPSFLGLLFVLDFPNFLIKVLTERINIV